MPMPLYEYQCQACDHRYERIERVSDPTTGTCPECGGVTRRLLGVPALQFKGSGWYVTDYGKGTGGKPGPEPKGSGDARSKEPGSKEPTSKASGSGDASSSSPKDSASSTSGGASGSKPAASKVA
jgi:putative FmdB family regulatory protein